MAEKIKIIKEEENVTLTVTVDVGTNLTEADKRDILARIGSTSRNAYLEIAELMKDRLH